MFDLIREIGQTLSHNKLRTALTGIAVSWGIFMLIVLLGMSHGVVNAFNGAMGSSRSDQMTVFGGLTTKPHAGYKEGRRVQLRNNDGEKVTNDNPSHIAEYSYTVSNRTAVVSTSNDFINGYAGVYPAARTNSGLTMVAGRFINDTDIEQNRKVAIIAKSKASTLFGSDSTHYVGSRVNISGLSFLVVGIYQHDWESTVYIPYTTAKMLDGNTPYINQMVVTIKDVNTMEQGEEVEKQTRHSLAVAHDFSPDDTGGVWIWNRFTQHMQMSTGLSLLDILVWVIGLLTMLTGIVGVSNIMFVSVKERTHEIGIRRAIGAKPRAILTQVIAESVVVTALFGYLGIVLGVGLTALLAHMFEGSTAIKNPGVDLWVAFEVTLVLIAAGALAGLFPALKALKVKPVEALRDE